MVISNLFKKTFNYVSICFIAGLFAFSNASINERIDPAIERSLLAEKWEEVYRMLGSVKPETPSTLQRLIKVHACLALNKSNEYYHMLSIFYPDEQLQIWKEYTDKLLLSNSKNAIAIYLNSDANARINNLNTAITIINKGLEVFSNHYLLLNSRGSIYVAIDQLDSALKDFYTITKNKPDFAAGHSNLGSIWILRKTAPQAAISAFNNALRISPESVVALNGRACANFAIGHFDEMISDFERARKISALYNTPLVNLAIFTQINTILINKNRSEARKINPGTSIEAINSYATSLNEKGARIELAYSKGHIEYNKQFKKALTALNENLSPEKQAIYSKILSIGNDISELANKLSDAEAAEQAAIQFEIDAKLNEMQNETKQLFKEQLNENQTKELSLSLMTIPKPIRIGIIIGGIIGGILFPPDDGILLPAPGTGEAIGIEVQPPVDPEKEKDKGGEGGKPKPKKPDKPKPKKPDKPKPKKPDEPKPGSSTVAGTRSLKNNYLNGNIVRGDKFFLIRGNNGCAVVKIPNKWASIVTMSYPPELPKPESFPPVLPQRGIIILDLNKKTQKIDEESKFWNEYQQCILKNHATLKPQGIETIDIINTFTDQGISLISDFSPTYDIPK